MSIKASIDSSPRVRVTPGSFEAPCAANGRPWGTLAFAPGAQPGERDAGTPCSEVSTIAEFVWTGMQTTDAGDLIDESPSTVPWIAAIGHDGQPYAGDLMSDILEYRMLRSRQLCGMALDIATTVRLSELERRLRSRPKHALARPEARAYHRYDCRFTAKVISTNGSLPQLVEVRDMSAGGVKIGPVPHDLDAGDAVWLELEGSVMLPARIAWTRDGYAGLMFAGAPRQR
jgi:hypothetical protein